MSVLITGGAGYIGSHICVELLHLGYEIVLLDNFSNSNPEVLNRIKRITAKEFEFYKADIMKKEEIERIFIENDIDSVIHLAGLKSVGESIQDPINYYNNNIYGTIILCELMDKYNVKNLVYSSSATVYGVNNESPLTEDMALSTTNPYGETKLVIENLLQNLFISDNSWRIVILRYFNPIGAHESGCIGEDPTGIPNNLMPYITQVASGKRKELKVFGGCYDTHDGTGVRDYIHVVDLAKGHIKALEKIMNSNDISIYNLGTGIGYSVIDIIESFQKSTGINIPYIITDERTGDIGTCYSDPTKSLKELKWKATKNLEDMCKDSWRWQSNNPNGY